MQVTKWNGKPISKPGWYSGIPIEVYHGPGICDGLAVSSSNLRTCWTKSPAHMFAEWAENPNRKEKEMTEAMLVGACAHFLLLGEDGFRTKYIPYPPEYPDKKTGVLKPWHMGADFCKVWAEKQIKGGRTPVTDKVLDSIIEMAKSLRREALVNEGMLRGYVEVSGFWKDQETGLWLKTRPDVVPMDGPEFVDLKTTKEVTTVSLMSTIRNFGYHMQGALVGEVCDGLMQPFDSFTMLFVETSNPWCARAVQMPAIDLGRGREMNRLMIRQIKDCIEQNRFPGPGEGELIEIGLSNDERARIDAVLKRTEKAA